MAEHPELQDSINDPLPNGSFGATPLLQAVSNRNRGMIEALLKAGADINARSHWWAGSFGVLDGDHGLHDFLIHHGAFVDAHAAARLGNLDRLAELLAAEPGLVNARGGDGQTPLHFAKNVEVARFLLDHGADIDRRDIDHESTPAQWMLRERTDVARYLVERGARTDILMAAALGDLERVRKHLADDPASINTTVNETYFPKKDPRSGGPIYNWTLGGSKTAHMVARDFGHEDVFRFLMEQSPATLQLVVATAQGDEGIVKRLLASQPDLAKQLSPDDRRRIAIAAEANNTKAVRLMLEAGWPVDARGLSRGTPLHIAAWHGNAEMVRTLIKHRAALEDTGDDHKMAPIGWALHGSTNSWHCKTGDYAGTVTALLEAGAKAPRVADDMELSPAVREALQRYSRTRA